MARSVSYADAVRLLGGETETLRRLDRLLGGALLAASAGALATGAPVIAAVGAAALSLFDAKAEFIRLGHELIAAVRPGLTGTSRLTRTERLHAAHTIIAVTAFVEALDGDVAPETVDDWLRHGWEAPRPEPRSTRRVRLRAEYMALTAHMWIVSDRFLSEAERRYEEMYERLAADIPEFAFWADLREHEATQELVQTGLAGLTDILTGMASGRVPQAKLTSLHAANVAAFGHPISETGDLPDGIRLPTHLDGYVNPCFRAVPYQRSIDLSAESAWAEIEVRENLAAFLIGRLTSPDAQAEPLLILGQPGAGKSVLTRVLAARLTGGDFLPVRVPLRQVQADAGIQQQIEEAVRVTTGERIDWPDLARSVNGALPVVMLDGLDELLQATGVHRADYLKQVADFQRREAELGRPLAVIVTTRTAVADRCPPPEDAMAIRLEPFSDDQVSAWLAAWNTANAGYFAARGLRPLAVSTALDHDDLARQPLLLLMLALYDADGNALPADADGFDKAGLYERLLRRFTAREIEKHHRDLPAEERARMSDDELLRLAIAAFAMFNRGRQWVTQEELDTDLRALGRARQVTSAGFAAPLSAAEVVIGRFFFIHQTEAVRTERHLRTYEFLHATFGEYLIAWLIHAQLTAIAARLAAPAGPLDDAPPAESRLRALLSYHALSTRAAILDFFADLAGPDMRDVLIRLFQTRGEGGGPSDYRPSTAPAIQRDATYAVNLVLLAAAPSRLDAAELFGAADTVSQWQRLARLWYAVLPNDQWLTLVTRLAVRRMWSGERRTLILGHRLEYGTDLDWIEGVSLDTSRWTLIWDALELGRQARFFGDELHETMAEQFLNVLYLDDIPRGFVRSERGDARSVTTILSHLWVGSDPLSYRDALTVLEAIQDDGQARQTVCSVLVRALAVDLPQLPDELVKDVLDVLLPYLSDSPEQLDLLVTCALELATRDGVGLDFVDECLRAGVVPQRAFLRVVVTAIEMEVSPGATPAVAFDVVRRMADDDLATIEQEDPHLFRRARRLIRAEGERYRLAWPKSGRS
ncbi:hypothetical protein J5X84_11215 [Streptosporangiaceae bacterium NEAU-GS5]|nr:hypothetical protein [Streptosporangiaceae bacterium NEAU-GS5]